MKYHISRVGVYSEEKGYKFEWKDTWRWLAHIPAGAVTTALITHPWRPEMDWRLVALGVVFWYGFIKYEIREEAKVGDFAFKDIFGGIVTIAILGVSIAIWF